MNTIEHIAAVLSDEDFYKENAQVGDPQAIIALVKAQVPEATDEEIDSFLTVVSEKLNANTSEELNEEALDEVAGGIVVTASVIGVVCACVGASVTVGGLVGSAIWYWKNRKN